MALHWTRGCSADVGREWARLETVPHCFGGCIQDMRPKVSAILSREGPQALVAAIDPSYLLAVSLKALPSLSDI